MLLPCRQAAKAACPLKAACLAWAGGKVNAGALQISDPPRATAFTFSRECRSSSEANLSRSMFSRRRRHIAGCISVWRSGVSPLCPIDPFRREAAGRRFSTFAVSQAHRETQLCDLCVKITIIVKMKSKCCCPVDGQALLQLPNKKKATGQWPSFHTKSGRRF